MHESLAPVCLGEYELPNRIVMAPMTRARAAGDGLPTPSMAEYYAQRASAGLIITEGAQISHQARGYAATPGIHTAEQVAAWRTVTDRIRAHSGRAFLQLWHVGRVSHPFFQDGALPVGPSALAVEGDAFTPDGPVPIPVPRALELSEMSGIVEQFANGARHAMQAGFDGVEIHGANGYLLDQFLRDGANQRSDAYGGSPAGRARLALEVVEAVTAVCGTGRVGYRVSPWFSMYSMSDSDPAATYGFLADGLAGKLAYLHVVEPVSGPGSIPAGQRLTRIIRDRFAGPVIANGGYDAASADKAIATGEADLVSFGIPFIANPDLPARFERGAALAQPDQPTIYGGGDQGYIDYPPMV